VEADPAVLRRRRVIAWSLIAAAIPTLVVGYYLRDGGHQIFAGFVGLNMLVAAGRLLWFNMAVRETEELRRRRLAKATGRVRSNR
jgi:undecaprenyl pyrophosphate phosphatase UppP